MPTGPDDDHSLAGAGGDAGARVRRPPDRARPRVRNRGRLRGNELPLGGRPGQPAVRLRADEHHGRLDDRRRTRHVRFRRRGRAGRTRGNRGGGRAPRVPQLARDRGAARRRARRLDARRRLGPDASRPHDEPPPRAGRGIVRGAPRRRRRRALPRDEQELVDRRQAPQLPVRDAGRVGDRERKAGPDAARCDVHGRDSRFLEQARRRRRAGGVEALRPHELRKGAGRAGGARFAWRGARSVPRRRGRRLRVSRVLDLADEALRTAGGDDAEVLVHAERSGVARFAASVVHQPTLIDNAVVRARVVRDGKIGWAATNRSDEQSLGELMARAGESADSAKPDPDFPGLGTTAAYPDVGGYDEETASLGAEDQARLAAAAIEAAPGFGLFGYFTSGVTEVALASSSGLIANQSMTDAVCICLAADDGASGWSERTSWRVGELDPAEPAREAAETAAKTRGAGTLEPGTYAAVLAPFAVAELVRWFSYDSLGAQGYLEERSYFCGRIGEQAFDPKISIADDALETANLPKAFDFEGTPKQRVDMIEGGVIRDVVWDRGTASRAGDGRSSTGHAPPDAWRFYGPLPTAFSMAGGDASSAEELAE